MVISVTQKRLESRALLEVTLDDTTQQYTLRRIVIDSFTPKETQTDFDASELIIDDTLTASNMKRLMEHISRTLSYLDTQH